MLNPIKQKDLEFIKEKIKNHLPLLLDFLGDNRSLVNYSKDLYEHKAEKIHIERQKQLIHLIKEKLSTIFSKKEIGEMDLDFRNGIISNIVDHHNILNHPILVSGLIISSLYYLLNSEAKSLFVLTCGDVPPNNFFHKKGFTYKDRLFPLFTNKDTHKIVYGLPKKELNFLDLAKERNLLEGLNEKERIFLEDYQGILSSVDFRNCDNFIDEITRTNYSIFRLMFEEKLRDEIPDLINFNTEYLASKVFCRLGKDSFMHRAVFDVKFREIVLKEFEGIWGAWSKGKGLGTHFFWLMLPNGEQEELVCEGDFLRAKDEKVDFKVKIDEKEISGLLEKKVLIPNLFLSYGIIIFYCGVKPLTGLGSMNYLSDMQNAWVRTLSAESQEEATLIERMSMKSLICSPIVTFARGENGAVKPQFFADIVSKGGLTKDYLENLAKMKFGDLMEMSLIDNYEVKVPQSEKKSLDITVADMANDKFNWLE